MELFGQIQGNSDNEQTGRGDYESPQPQVTKQQIKYLVEHTYDSLRKEIFASTSELVKAVEIDLLKELRRVHAEMKTYGMYSPNQISNMTVSGLVHRIESLETDRKRFQRAFVVQWILVLALALATFL